MSTLELFLDHAHLSPRGRVFAPRKALSRSRLPRWLNGLLGHHVDEPPASFGVLARVVGLDLYLGQFQKSAPATSPAPERHRRSPRGSGRR